MQSIRLLISDSIPFHLHSAAVVPVWVGGNGCSTSEAKAITDSILNVSNRDGSEGHAMNNRGGEGSMQRRRRRREMIEQGLLLRPDRLRRGVGDEHSDDGDDMDGDADDFAGEEDAMLLASYQFNSNANADGEGQPRSLPSAQPMCFVPAAGGSSVSQSSSVLSPLPTLIADHKVSQLFSTSCGGCVASSDNVTADIGDATEISLVDPFAAAPSPSPSSVLLSLNTCGTTSPFVTVNDVIAAVEANRIKEKGGGGVQGTAAVSLYAPPPSSYLFLLRQHGNAFLPSTSSSSSAIDAMLPMLLSPTGVVVWSIPPYAVPSDAVRKVMLLRSQKLAHSKQPTPNAGNNSGNNTNTTTASGGDAAAALHYGVIRASLGAALSPLCDAMSIASLLTDAVIPTTIATTADGSGGNTNTKATTAGGSKQQKDDAVARPRPLASLVIHVKLDASQAFVNEHYHAIVSLLERCLLASAAFSPSEPSAAALSYLLPRFFGCRIRIRVEGSSSCSSQSPLLTPPKEKKATPPQPSLAFMIVQSAAEVLVANCGKVTEGAAMAGVCGSSPPPTLSDIAKRFAEALTVVERLLVGSNANKTNGGALSSISGGAASSSSAAALLGLIPVASCGGTVGTASVLPAASAVTAAVHHAMSMASSTGSASAANSGGIARSRFGNGPSASSALSPVADLLVAKGGLHSIDSNGYVMALLRLVNHTNATTAAPACVVGRSDPSVPLPPTPLTTSTASNPAPHPLARLREQFVLQDATAVLQSLVASEAPKGKHSSMYPGVSREEGNGAGGGVHTTPPQADGSSNDNKGRSSNGKSRGAFTSAAQSEADNEEAGGRAREEEEEEGSGVTHAIIETITSRLSALLLGNSVVSQPACEAFAATAASLESSMVSDVSAARSAARQERRRVRISMLAHALLGELEKVEEWVAKERACEKAV